MPSEFDIANEEHDIPSSAKRVLQVDAAGDPVTPPASPTNYAQETGGNLDAIAATLALIKAKTNNLDVALSTVANEATRNLAGAGTHGTRDLTSANTWYAVPSTVPTAAYILIAQPRTGNAGTIRWSFLNSGTPGAGTGLEIQGNLVLRLAANESVVFASSTAGDDVDWTCKEIV